MGAAAVRYVKSHRRKESLAEKLLLGPIEDDIEFENMSADVEFICVVYRYRIYVNIDKYI